MARQRPSNSESTKPVLTLRVTPDTMQKLDDLVEEHGGSRASIAGEALSAALNGKYKLNIQAISAKERAAHKAASVVRARLMAAVRAELEEIEAEG